MWGGWGELNDTLIIFFTIMANLNKFSLNNISSNSEFDFLSLFNNDNHAGIINDFVNDSPYADINLSCSYLDESQFVQKFKNFKQLSFMSFNIQSLPSKFADFQELICNLELNNCAPDIICLQEIWKIPDNSVFGLNNYHPPEFLQRGNNLQGGGVGLYFRSNLKFKILKEKCIFIDRIFESIFAEVESNNKKFIVGSIYRLATSHHSLTSFKRFFERKQACSPIR